MKPNAVLDKHFHQWNESVLEGSNHFRFNIVGRLHNLMRLDNILPPEVTRVCDVYLTRLGSNAAKVLNSDACRRFSWQFTGHRRGGARRSEKLFKT